MHLKHSYKGGTRHAGKTIKEPIEELSDALGQPRAVEALRFGAGMKHTGYNIFALGPPGSGRHTMVEQVLKRQMMDLVNRVTNPVLLMR